MSDGISDANRIANEVSAVESAAHKLALALRATGDAMFFAVHPDAISIANEYLRDCGYRLVPRKGPER
jgi:hypothetical protein